MRVVQPVRSMRSAVADMHRKVRMQTRGCADVRAEGVSTLLRAP